MRFKGTDFFWFDPVWQRASEVRARCAHITGGSNGWARWLLSFLFLLPGLAAASEEGLQEEARVVVVDTTQPPGALSQSLASAEGDLAHALDAMGAQGLWLLPARCVVPEGQSGGTDPTSEAIEALFEQDADGVRAAAAESIAAMVCSREPVSVDSVATSWFFLGVAAWLEETDGGQPGALSETLFAAVHGLPTETFVAPDIGKGVRDAFEAAAGGVVEGPDFVPPTAKGQWRIDGVAIDQSAVLGLQPHVLQLTAPSGDSWTAVLSPTNPRWRLLGTPGTAAASELDTLIIGAHRSDVARWLRVTATGGEASLSPADRRAISLSMGAGPWRLEVPWASPSGEVQTWVLTDVDVAKAAPGEPEVDTSSVDVPLVNAEPHLVAVSAGLGGLAVRGALFVPLKLDVAIKVAKPLRIELSAGGGVDMGSQGGQMRGVAMGAAALRFNLREDMGLTAAVGSSLLTRGPDPEDPDVFLIEAYSGGWLRWRPPSLAPRPGLYFETGATVAPGVWRSDGLTSGSSGLMGWLVVGVERR